MDKEKVGINIFSKFAPLNSNIREELNKYLSIGKDFYIHINENSKRDGYKFDISFFLNNQIYYIEFEHDYFDVIIIPFKTISGIKKLIKIEKNNMFSLILYVKNSMKENLIFFAENEELKKTVENFYNELKEYLSQK